MRRKQTEKEVIKIKEESIIIEREETLEINTLMPAVNSNFDDMERIVDLKSEFSQAMDPILRMYNAAMNEAIARFEIIKDEFQFRKQRCPIHHIDSRLKSADSILGKLQKKQMELTLTAACNCIFDIAGVRIVCPYVKDIYLLRERIMAQDDIMIMEEKDYVAHPKRNGYRSLHIVIRVPVYFMNKKQMVPVELQIRSLAMDLWASLEHDLKYKSSQNESNIDFTAKLYECSKLIYQAEDEMEKINDLLEDGL
ncbi:MAG: (p)ppGpp synthetase [Lachnospiraceae bacterium]|nr:(p)ppGpp synthetase [Lachnospiraceae bacterium]MDD3796927.1 (p)ppGpp synthetase [Lachnospiraceae bacterium]